MSEHQERNRRIFALPLERQREALLPVYEEIYAAYAVDWETNTGSFDRDDYEFALRGTVPFPGLPERVEGLEGYVAGHRELLDVVDLVRVQIDDLIPLGDGRVVVLTRYVVRAGDGEVEQQILELHQFRDGLLWRHYYWFHRDEGRQELGI